MHRLFVAISGVADQLQTNHARDLRVILKHVFTVCQMEEEEEEEGEEGEGEEDKYEGAAEVEEDLFMTETRASFTGFSAVESQFCLLIIIIIIILIMKSTKVQTLGTI